MNFELPAQGHWTVDDLRILPDEFRYELIDGWIDVQDRAPLSALAGLAVMGALKSACPPDLRVFPRRPVAPGSDPAPDVVVLDAAGPLLAVDVVQPDWSFAEMLTRTRVFAESGLPHYWVIESMEWRGLSLTAFVSTDEGGYRVLASTGNVFTTQVPYRVTVDLPAMSTRWPAVFEYSGGA